MSRQLLGDPTQLYTAEDHAHNHSREMNIRWAAKLHRILKITRLCYVCCVTSSSRKTQGQGHRHPAEVSQILQPKTRSQISGDQRKLRTMGRTPASKFCCDQKRLGCGHPRRHMTGATNVPISIAYFLINTKVKICGSICRGC